MGMDGEPAFSGLTRRPIEIGRHCLRAPVLLAPMSGVTDLPFRRLVHALGAGLVVSEMVASEHLVRERHDARRRAEGRELTPFVIQLAGCEARWMAEGARVAEGLGADIIDINMGCPAREVTGEAVGFGADARPRPRARLDRGYHRRRQGARHVEDAARLG